MKKTSIVAVVLASLLLCSSAAWAEGRYKTIEAFFEVIHFTMNGQPLPVRDDSIIYEGSVYVPLRSLAQMLGAKVGWDDKQRTVSLNFIADESTALESASKKGIYQYIALENNSIMRDMIDRFQKDDMEGIKDDINRYDKLRDYAVAIDDAELLQILDKLASSGEIIRSGISANNLEQFSLAWKMFNSNAKSLIDLLNARISGTTTKAGK
jgi:hypothetical protein